MAQGFPALEVPSGAKPPLETAAGDSAVEGEAEVAEEAFPIPDRPEIRAVVEELSGPRRGAFAAALRRAERYLPMIREIFASEGLPEELVYLPVVESHFKLYARSRAGALGLWQFMGSTARASGLRVDWWVDERLDPEAATRAAARHLKELYAQFGDWELALAAYNAGPGGVARALHRSGARGFWDLAAGRGLRAETRRYVPKFYATLTIVRDPGAYRFGLEEAEDLLEYDTVGVESPVDLPTVAKASGVPLRALRTLNPALLRGCTPPETRQYPLRVPPGSGSAVAEHLASIPPSQRLSFLRHRVRPGDTLWGIAKRYGTRSKAVAELNGVRNARSLRPGHDLVVPVRNVPARAEASLARTSVTDGGHTRTVHVVAPGDTVWGIARRYGVTLREVARWNQRSPSDPIHPGDRLVVGVRADRADTRVAGSRVHVVRKGDTLWSISQRYEIPLKDLMRENRLGPKTLLRPGDRLVLSMNDHDPT